MKANLLSTNSFDGTLFTAFADKSFTQPVFKNKPKYVNIYFSTVHTFCSIFCCYVRFAVKLPTRRSCYVTLYFNQSVILIEIVEYT